jgi:hypothetical protein
MLKQLILENWKSFRYAELPLDPLTVLIGTNASGKSNVVEALEFLQRIARGENIETALAGDKILSSIRGGVEWAAFKPETKFRLKTLVKGEDDRNNSALLDALGPEIVPFVVVAHRDTALPAAMRYILKAESDDRRGVRRKLYCITAGSAVKKLEKANLHF